MSERLKRCLAIFDRYALFFIFLMIGVGVLVGVSDNAVLLEYLRQYLENDQVYIFRIYYAPVCVLAFGCVLVAAVFWNGFQKVRDLTEKMQTRRLQAEEVTEEV